MPLSNTRMDTATLARSQREVAEMRSELNLGEPNKPILNLQLPAEPTPIKKLEPSDWLPDDFGDAWIWYETNDALWDEGGWLVDMARYSTVCTPDGFIWPSILKLDFELEGSIQGDSPNWMFGVRPAIMAYALVLVQLEIDLYLSKMGYLKVNEEQYFHSHGGYSATNEAIANAVEASRLTAMEGGAA